jgi:hypothetical protein
MKCSFCTYDHKPENPFILKAHAEQDILDGKTRGIIPVAVWRDGGFLLVEAPEDGEQVYEIGIVDSRPVYEEDLGFEPIPDEEESPLEDSTKVTKP